MTSARTLSVGIASRNRPEALVRCLTSLGMIEDILEEVIVTDDGSADPLEPVVRGSVPPAVERRLRVIRFDPSRGLAAARSACVRRAATPWVLSLDDDAVIVSADAVRSAVRTIAADPSIFAIAFTQADAAGQPWPAGVQPASVDHPCEVASFIGFGHLVRRDAFLTLDGFRAQLIINGEERELCLRALDAGFRVVYLPSARIAHLADPRGRDVRQYLHLTVRNGVLASIYNDPLPLLCVRVPMRLLAYFRMRRGWKVDDRGGFVAIVRWLARDLGAAARLRNPVRWSTIRRWRYLVRHTPTYRSPA